MKKLTAGIFATLLTMVSVDGAYAAIASKGYVDEQVGTVEATVATKADKSALDTLSETVTGHTTQIAGKADKATTLEGYGITDAYTSAQGTALEGRVSEVETPKATVATGQTGPVSGQTVYNAIQGVTGNVGDVQGRVESLETTVEELQTSKQDADTAVEVGTAGTAVGSTTQPVYVNESGVVTPTNALGSLAWKSTVATADIADKAVTEAKLSDTVNASLDKADTALQRADLDDYVTETEANAAYAAKTLEGQVGTVSKENMGTTNATTVVGGVKEAIDAAKAADTKAGQAATAASTAQSDVDALEGVVNNEATGLAAAHTAIDALESGKLDKTGTAVRATADASGNEITATYATKAEIADMATNENLALKQDKTDDALNTTVKTVVGAINEVKTTADGAKTAADAAQADATQAISDAEEAQAEAEAKIPLPTGECSNPTAKCVLVSNGTNSFEWEVIARDGEGK